MTYQPSNHELSPPVSATALLVDLRNFTPNLNAAKEDERGINLYCHFLADFYALCLDASLVALPPSLRIQPPLYMSSTGDGVLILFLHESHARQGFLTASILHRLLTIKCDSYCARAQAQGCPKTCFGLGVDSGKVSRIHAYPPGKVPYPIVDTCIGPCINVAARAEVLTKSFSFARTIVTGNTNEVLCHDLFGESYDALARQARESGISDEARLELHDKMNDFNRSLCLAFIHYHNLKGVEQPVAMFRFAGSTVYLGNPRYEQLLTELTEGADHLEEARDFLVTNMPRGPLA